MTGRSEGTREQRAIPTKSAFIRTPPQAAAR